MKFFFNLVLVSLGTLPLYADTNDKIQFFTKAIQENPKNSQAYFHRGKAYWEAGKYDLAVEDLTKTLELDPKNVEALEGRGEAYLHLMQPKKTIEDLNRALETDPKNAKSYFRMGVAYSLQEDYDSAFNCYNKAIEIDPNYGPPYANRGSIYCTEKKDYQKGIKDFNKSIELNCCNMPSAYYGLVCAYNCLGEYDLAIKTARKWVKAFPKDDMAERFLGEAKAMKVSQENKAAAANEPH